MAITKVSRGLLNTGIEDNSDATAITIDSSESITLSNDVIIGPVNEGVRITNNNSPYGGRITIGNAAGANTGTNSLYIEKSTQYDYLMEFVNIHANGQGFMLSAGHGSSYLQFQTLNYNNTIAGIRIRGNGDWEINAGYGSFGKAYAVRAWANINQSTNAVRSSGNISSATDNGTGQYTINLSTAFPDTNYVFLGTASNENNGVGIDGSPPTTYTTTAVKVRIFDASNIYQELTDGILNVAVIR